MGDVVVFCRSGFLFAHAAICVSPDFYISVFGTNADLEFAMSEDIHDAYGTSDICILS